MAKFIHGDTLSQSITGLFKEPDVRMAVAFWGLDAVKRFPELIPKRTRVICNLVTGGTDPRAIAELRRRGASVNHCNTLHAKVYIGRDFSIVTSANASINGLGLEGVEQSRWIEAGVKVSSEGPAAWFDALWSSTEPVSDADLVAAEQVFRARASFKPTRLFEDFNVHASDLPLVHWWYGTNSVTNYERASQELAISEEDAVERLDNGIEIYDPSVEVFPPNTWCLHYRLNYNGRASKRSTPSWICLAGSQSTVFDVREYAGRDGKRTVHIMPAAEIQPPAPFVITPRFKSSFLDVVNSSGFRELRAMDWGEGAFFTKERKESIREFWAALRVKYFEPRAKARL